MIGGGLIVGLALAATPDLPARAAPAAKPITKSLPAAMPSAVQLGAKWGIVTSVHRSPARNRAVGGAPNSFHLAGRAIDIARRPGVRHAEIDAAYRGAGYRLLESLDEGDHSHFAFGLPVPLPAVPPVQLAAAAPPCPAASPSERRRPDRDDGCAVQDKPASRLRPLDQTP